MNVSRMSPGCMFINKDASYAYFIISNTKSTFERLIDVTKNPVQNFHDVTVLKLNCETSTLQCITWECMSTSVEFFDNEDWIKM